MTFEDYFINLESANDLHLYIKQFKLEESETALVIRNLKLAIINKMQEDNPQFIKYMQESWKKFYNNKSMTPLFAAVSYLLNVYYNLPLDSYIDLDVRDTVYTGSGTYDSYHYEGSISFMGFLYIKHDNRLPVTNIKYVYKDMTFQVKWRLVDLDEKYLPVKVLKGLIEYRQLLRELDKLIFELHSPNLESNREIIRLYLCMTYYLIYKYNVKSYSLTVTFMRFFIAGIVDIEKFLNRIDTEVKNIKYAYDSDKDVQDCLHKIGLFAIPKILRDVKQLLDLSEGVFVSVKTMPSMISLSTLPYFQEYFFNLISNGKVLDNNIESESEI